MAASQKKTAFAFDGNGVAILLVGNLRETAADEAFELELQP